MASDFLSYTGRLSDGRRVRVTFMDDIGIESLRSVQWRRKRQWELADDKFHKLVIDLLERDAIRLSFVELWSHDGSFRTHRDPPRQEVERTLWRGAQPL